MDQPAAWGLVRWLARKAGVDVGELNPHSLRHRFVTAALTPAFRCETCKTPPDTPTPARPAATTEHGTTSTVQ